MTNRSQTRVLTQADQAVESFIADFSGSKLAEVLGPDESEWLVMKYVGAVRAHQYTSPAPLWVSETPLQTWGTATYVAPLSTPLTSLMYGRIGLACPVNPRDWRIFDATHPAALHAYIRWARAQPILPDLVTTVHSTWTNHVLRDTFRRQFRIDCVLFRPDQESHPYTNMIDDVWLAVTDWTPTGTIATKESARLNLARLAVLIDEEFPTEDADGLPIRASLGQLESPISAISPGAYGMPLSEARRTNPSAAIADAYRHDTFVHLYIEP